MSTRENDLTPPKTESQWEKLDAHMARQTALMEQMVQLQRGNNRRENIREGLRWAKHLLIIGAVVWGVVQAKMFFESMFDAITPDFSGVQESVEGGYDSLKSQWDALWGE